MSNHLTLKIGGKQAVLPEDFSIDVEDVNPLFNDYESFSFDASLPIHSNRHILKDLDHLQSDKRMIDFENESIELIVDGISFRSGKLQVREDENIENQVTFSMVSSSSTLQDIVADMTCQDVPVKDKVQIGEMLGDVTVQGGYDYSIVAYRKTPGYIPKRTAFVHTSIHEKLHSIPALGFSYPAVCKTTGKEEIASHSMGKVDINQSFINTTDEYPLKPYFNSRVCYKHYKKEEDGTSGKTVSTSGDTDPYYVLDADRPQSGICFYLLYFLDCLFAYLGLDYKNDPLLHVGDLKRLGFFTTACKFDVERKYPQKGIPGVDAAVEYDLNSLFDINRWARSRHAGGQLSFDWKKELDIDSIVINGKLYSKKHKPDRPGMHVIKVVSKNFSVDCKANILNMYANSKNFPEMSVSEVLDSLWGAFGIRFIVDYERKKARPVLIREVYRSQEPPLNFEVQLIDAYKVVEKITGVRMCYSAESDDKEKKENVRNKVRDYDTRFDYIDYSQVDATLSYRDIVKRCNNSDMTCYIDRNTGNAYRFKVDSEAETEEELKPAVFEVGMYNGVSVGDCSKKNEDFVVELSNSFEPLDLNDLNGKKAGNIGSDEVLHLPDATTGEQLEISGINGENKGQKLVPFMNEDMWNEECSFDLTTPLKAEHSLASARMTITTKEMYDPSSTDDGSSPLQHYDWGSAITIMREGGSDAEIEVYDYNYDGCGNSKWRMKSGEYAISPDSIDCWGNEYDYNGTQAGVGEDERFSLKIRAYKEVNGEILCNEDKKDATGKVTTKIRTRGLFDTFLSEHAHFLLHRKKMIITFRCNVSRLLDIQWERKYRIGQLAFWFNKLNYNISSKEGLSTVTAEIYVI